MTPEAKRIWRKKYQAMLKRRGLCRYCAKPAVEGLSACQTCREKRAISQKGKCYKYLIRLRVARKEQGLCRDCGKRPHIEGSCRCEECRAKAKARWSGSQYIRKPAPSVKKQITAADKVALAEKVDYLRRRLA